MAITKVVECSKVCLLSASRNEQLYWAKCEAHISAVCIPPFPSGVTVSRIT